MSDAINNEPAFPGTQYARGISPSGHNAGMTLRDYFAAKAMQGYLTHEQAANCCSVDLVARWSYEMADAMLRARGNV